MGAVILGNNREWPDSPLFINSSMEDLWSTYYVQGVRVGAVKNDSEKLKVNILRVGGGAKPPSVALFKA